MLLIGLIAKAQTPKQNPNQSDSEPTAFCWPSWSSLVFLRDVTWEGQTARHARLVAGATLSASAAAGKPAVLIMKHFNRVETWRRHLMNRSLMPCPRRREDRQTVAVYAEIHFELKFRMMCSAQACASSFRCSGTNGAPCGANTST
jgi:hypothetical protein